MDYISVNYAVDYELEFSKNYKWTKNGKCFNSKTQKEIKQVYKNRTVGYYINGKFMSLTKLRKHLIKIENNFCPF